MTQDLRRELRLFGLISIMLVVYGTMVATYAASHGQLRLLLTANVGDLMATIWITAFAFVFCAYAIDLLVRRRPERPLMVMITALRAQILRPHLLLARATVVLGFFCLITFFTPFKVLIGHVRGFPHDAVLQRFDRMIFAGHDPWEVTHALFGSASATFVLNAVYAMWFVVMWIGLIYMLMRPEPVRLRARYLIAFMLAWIILGSFVAYFLASAGPCYVERVFGDPHFRPLMDRLHAIDSELRAMGPGLGIHALIVQDVLWTSFAAKRELFGGGISAMPSMHVSVSVLMACASWHLNRKAGWLLTIYAALIWIGSVHLGWHYALDGIVAIGATLAIWRLSDWLVDRFVMREAPAAAWQPALAE